MVERFIKNAPELLITGLGPFWQYQSSFKTIKYLDISIPPDIIFQKAKELDPLIFTATNKFGVSLYCLLQYLKVDN